MCSSSSATSGKPPTIQQLIQKSTNPTPQQATAAALKNSQSGSSQDTLNTSGSRGTQVNFSS